MGRSGYSDIGGWELIMWRGAVASAIRGHRGQAFLRDLVTALDAIPTKRLIAHKLERDGEVCALGSVGKMRGLAMTVNVDIDEWDEEVDGDVLGKLFGIAPAMAKEIMFVNDEGDFWGDATPEQRWERMRAWAVANLTTTPAVGQGKGE